MNIGQLSYSYRNKIQKQLILPHCPVYRLQKDKMEWFFPSQNLVTLKKRLENTTLIRFCQKKSQENQFKAQKQIKQNGELLIVKISKNYLQDKLRHIINQHLNLNEQANSHICHVRQKKNQSIQSFENCHVCDSYQTDYCTSLVKINEFRQFLYSELQNKNQKSPLTFNQLTPNNSFQIVQKIFNIKYNQKINQNFVQNEGVNNQHLKLDAVYFLIKLKEKDIKNYRKQKRVKLTKEQIQKSGQLKNDWNVCNKNMTSKDEIIQIQWTSNYLLLNHMDVKKLNNYIQNKSQKQENQNIGIKVKNNKKISEHMKLKLAQKCQQLQEQIKKCIQSKYSELIKNKNLKLNINNLTQTLKEQLAQQKVRSDLQQTIKIQSFRLWGYVNSQNMQIYTIFVSDIKCNIGNMMFQLFDSIQISFNQKTAKIPELTKNIALQKLVKKEINQNQTIIQCRCCKKAVIPQQTLKIINKNVPLIQLFKKIKMIKINDFNDKYQMVEVCRDCYDIFLTNIYKEKEEKVKKMSKSKNSKQYILLKKEKKEEQFQNLTTISQKEKENLKNIENYKKNQEQHQNDNKKKVYLYQLTQNTQISTINKNEEDHHTLRKTQDSIKNRQQIKQMHYLIEKDINPRRRNSFQHKNVQSNRNSVNDSTHLYCYKNKNKSKSIYQTSNVSTIGTSLAHSLKGRKNMLIQRQAFKKQQQKAGKQNQNNYTNLSEDIQDELLIKLKQKNTVQIPKRPKIPIHKMSNTKYIHIQAQDCRHLNNITLHQAKKDKKTIKNQLKNQNLNSQQINQTTNKIDKNQFKQMILNQICSYNKNNKVKQTVSEFKKKEQPLKSLHQFQKNKKQQEIKTHVYNKQ